MKNIIIIGSANIDLIIKSKRFPESGETIIGGEFFKSQGGKGANQAVAAARLGGDVSFIARVGSDDFGNQAIQQYKEEGISIDHITIDKNLPTGVALISVNDLGENKIVVAPGANNGFTVEEIETVHEILRQADFIVMQLEIPLKIVGKVIQIAKQYNTSIILNPAPAQELSDWFYEDLYLITPNETETEILTGITVQNKQSAHEAAKWFQNKGVKNVIITMGKQGSYMVTEEGALFISAPKVDSMDTTAAGDVFNGALAVALTQKKSFEDSVRFASDAAALSVTKIGAQSSCPTSTEVEAFQENLSLT